MNEIKCPKCGTTFKIDESEYETIVKQIRNNEFENEIKRIHEEHDKNLKRELELTKISTEKSLQEELNKKTLEIQNLKNEIELNKKEKDIEITKEKQQLETKIQELNSKLELSKNEYIIKENNLKEKYEEKLKTKDEQISYYKDFKAKQSTKMIGESLELHCYNEFNKLRPLFKNAYFEKDNDAKTGSKGDFIFKDIDEDGN